MKLYSASSLFNISDEEIHGLINSPDTFEQSIIAIKKKLLEVYKLQAINLPTDFATKSYIVAPNHLTDSDAPLVMSYYYQVMHDKIDEYPRMFVFAKENCFNGVSLPQELLPLLNFEKIVEVDRNKATGSLQAIKEASKWVKEANGKPRHFLIFPQGTIYDINLEKLEDIERGTFWLASLLGIAILPAFIEMAKEGELNRLVFGKPIDIPKNCRDYEPYKKLWVDEIIEAQNSLATLTKIPARKAVLDEDHIVRKRFHYEE